VEVVSSDGNFSGSSWLSNLFDSWLWHRFYLVLHSFPHVSQLGVWIGLEYCHSPFPFSVYPRTYFSTPCSLVPYVGKALCTQAVVRRMYHDRPRTLNGLKPSITAYMRNISQADLRYVFANKIEWV
jgi:hypothetical protein